MNQALADFDWIAAIQTWFLVILCAGVAGYLLASLLAGAARGSLVDGFGAAAQGAIDLFRETVTISPRRVAALAKNTIRESIRRRMLLAVFGVLVVIFMFGGWYLDSRPTEQVKVYVSFVLLSSTLIAIPAGALLACLSLPSDIKDKTIHTVITKPVRRFEIILGRIIGLTVVTTAFLVVMGALSYVYMRRSVGGTLAELQQRLDEAQQRGDRQHEEELKDNINQIESKLTARVPVYGSKFYGASKNVGFESTKRLFIEGNSPDVAIWEFEELPVQRLVERQRIPLELIFAVFRTSKGEVGRGVLGQITFVNPNTRRQITDYPFEVREYYVNQQSLDNTPDPGRNYFEEGRTLPAPPPNPLEWLLQGSNGRLAVEVRCISGAQYIGMAQGDLYVLLDRASFGWNFAKGMVGVWLRVLVIICVAVMFSTVLSSYVAMLATAAVFVGGWRMPYLRDLAQGRTEGGGPLEAALRLVTHDNLQRPLDQGLWTDVIKGGDYGLRTILQGITHVLPDLGVFNTGRLVADGFDISLTNLLSNGVVAMAYAVPVVIASYYLLRSREIAR